MLQDYLLEKLHDIANDGIAIGFGFSPVGQPTEHICTYDASWQDHYWRNNLIYRDPIIKFGAGNLGAVRWSDVDLEDPQNAVLQAREFNMKDGMVLSVQVDGERAIAGLATSSRPSDAAIKEARIILAALQASKTGEPTLDLTQRQKEILRLIAGGASAASTARELNIEESTVNFHKREALRRNRGKVSNFTSLLTKAIRTDLI
jgi:LuxR family transcriptional regulator